MNIIETLTPEQKDEISKYVDKWTKIALSTEQKPNKNAATSAIKEFYHIYGYKAPEKTIFTESPLESILLLTYISYPNKSLEESILKSNLTPKTLERTLDYIKTLNLLPEKSVGEGIRYNLNAKKDPQLKNISPKIQRYLATCFNKLDFCWDIIDYIHLEIKKLIYPDNSTNFYQSDIYTTITMIENQCFHMGSFESSNLCCYDYDNKVLGLNYNSDKLESSFNISKHCGFIVPFEKLCIVTPKPRVLNVISNQDNCKILHNTDGPAIYYCDEFQIWVNG